MHRQSGLFSRFARDERGAFAVMFGLMAIVLIALGGAVVDYVALEQSRNRAQIALDAAALALQPEIFNTTITDEDIRLKAEALLLDRIGPDWSVDAGVEEIRTSIEDGSLYLRARMTMPTIFVRLVGVNELSAQVQSEATRKKLALEVAFVLDNSGSMAFTGAGANGTRQRMQFLKDAAKCAVNILFFKDVRDDPDNLDTCIPVTGATQIDDVSVALVPFNMLVNVGTANANAAWIDGTGTSVISNDNFDNDDDESTAPPAARDRFALFAATKEAWRGCVESRPHIKSGTLSTEYLDTDDTAPTGANTRFVPMFSPDFVNGFGGNNYVSDSPEQCDRPAQGTTTCQQTQTRTNCNTAQNNGSCTTAAAVTQPPIGPTNFNSDAKYTGGYYGAHATTCDCRTWGAWSTYAHVSGSNNAQTFRRTRSCSGGGYIPTGLSTRTLQERICKYYGTLNATAFATGPNAECVRTAILALSQAPATIISTINGMVAEGGTNIHEGAAWGFRALSPSLPFNQGGPYDEATSKVMIVMTDGENTAYNLPSPNNPSYCSNKVGGQTAAAFNGSCFYSAYGFPYNSRNTNTASSSGGNIERLGPVSSNMGSVASNNATLVAQMNARTRDTCENAKAQGITIYTIGLATSLAVQSTQAEVEDMLADCASTRDKAFFPQTPGGLKAVFQAIANDLSALRLAQ